MCTLIWGANKLNVFTKTLFFAPQKFSICSVFCQNEKEEKINELCQNFSYLICMGAWANSASPQFWQFWQFWQGIYWCLLWALSVWASWILVLSQSPYNSRMKQKMRKVNKCNSCNFRLALHASVNEDQACYSHPAAQSEWLWQSLSFSFASLTFRHQQSKVRIQKREIRVLKAEKSFLCAALWSLK